VLYQYFEGIYYERYYKRDITVSLTILFVRGERERKKNNKTDILRVRSKRKKKLLIKKIWICERRLFHLFQKIIFFGVYVWDDWIPDSNLPSPEDIHRTSTVEIIKDEVEWLFWVKTSIKDPARMILHHDHKMHRNLDCLDEWCRSDKFVQTLVNVHQYPSAATCGPLNSFIPFPLMGRRSKGLMRSKTLEGLWTEECCFVPYRGNYLQIIKNAFIERISREFHDPYTHKTQYTSLVRPSLEHAACIWSPHQSVHSERLERVQHNFFRMRYVDCRGECVRCRLMMQYAV
jgi:hypothetical protein